MAMFINGTLPKMDSFLANVLARSESDRHSNQRQAFALTAMTLSCLMAGGCVMGPNYARPKDTLPNAYTEKSTASDAASDATLQSQQLVTKDIPSQWWEVFHSQALNDLVTSSLQHNPNVTAAQATLRAAIEGVKAQQGAYYPTVDVAYAASREKTAAVLASPLASNSYIYNLQTAQVNVSYTLDLFGANRRQVESLKAQAEASRFELEGTYLTLSSNVVSAAIQEAMLRDQIRITHDLIASQKALLETVKHQLALGDASTVDVTTQDAALATIEATLPPLEKQLAIQRDLIKSLAGQFPSDTLAEQFSIGSLELPNELPVSLPSTLVEHRPDIRAAEEQLRAANANVGAAIANRLPNITLGVSSYGTSGSTLADLLKSSSQFWTLAGGITQPIFDGGTLRHKQRVAQAQYDLAAAQYRSTVLGAFQNVADVLQSIQSDTNALNTAMRSERLATKSAAIAKQQVALGDMSIAAYLPIEQNEQQAELNLIQAQANRLQDTAALFQALGGGWWNRTDITQHSK